MTAAPERFEYKTSKRKIVHLPVNRIETPFQTEKALDESKVKENMRKIRRGERMEPLVIGNDYQLFDGHHRLEAAKRLGHTHVPCRVDGLDDEEAQKAYEKYTSMYKSAFTEEIERKYPGGEWRTLRGHHVYMHDGEVVKETQPDWLQGGKLHAKIHFQGHAGYAYGGKEKDAPTDPAYNDEASHFRVSFPNFDFKNKEHMALKDALKKHTMGWDAEGKAWKVPIDKYDRAMRVLQEHGVVTRHTPEGKEAADVAEEWKADTKGIIDAQHTEFLKAQEDSKPPVDPKELPGTDVFYHVKPPHGYQWKGVNWLMRARKGNLGFDVGLGKTITAITAAESLKHLYKNGRDERMKNPTAIIAPASKLFGWQDDINEIMKGKKILVLHDGMTAEQKESALKAAYSTSGGAEHAGDRELEDLFSQLHGMNEHPEAAVHLANNAALSASMGEKGKAVLDMLKHTLTKHRDTETTITTNSNGHKVRKHVSNKDKELVDKILAHISEYETGKRKYAPVTTEGGDKPDYVIMSYETARDLGHHAKGKVPITIADEAHYLKGKDSQRSLKVEENFGQSPYHWWLSATPMPNNLDEAYRAMQFFNPNVLGSYEDFKDKYCITEAIPVPKYKNGKKTYMHVEKVVGYRNQDAFKKAIAPYFFMKNAESKDVHIDLPKLNKQKVALSMDNQQLKAYNRAKTELQQSLGGVNGDNAASAAQMVALGKMLVASVDPRLAYKDMDVPKGYVAPKIKQAAQALANNYDQTKKGAIVFCNSPDALDYLKDHMKKEYGYTDKDFGVIKGGVSSKKKAQVEKDFNAGKIKFVLGTAAGEAGINLQKNSNLHINLDETWTPAGMQQREGRGYRQGQKNPFTILQMQARGSAEERRSLLLQKKRDLINRIFSDGKEDTKKLTGTLTVDDIRYIMGDGTEELGASKPKKIRTKPGTRAKKPTTKAPERAKTRTKSDTSAKKPTKSSKGTQKNSKVTLEQPAKKKKATKTKAPSVAKKVTTATKKATKATGTPKKSSSGKKPTGRIVAKPKVQVTATKKGAKKA